MNNYKKCIVLFLKRFLLIALIYQFSRLLFYFLNLNLFEPFTFQTFLGGLLFDFAAISYLNIPFIIAHLIPGNFKYNNRYQHILKISFYSANLLFIATNFVDIIYYRFTGRRSTYKMITAKGMEHEVFGLIPSFLKEFWYIGILFIIISILFWKLIPDLNKNPTPQHLTKRDYFIKSSYLILSITVLVILGRGGFQKKPIKIVDGIKYGALGNTALVLNTPFTILTTIAKKEDLDNVNYYSSKELKSIYNPVISLQSDKPATKKNVVILILESFGNENIGRGQTPFLDSLITKSYYFKNGFANGKVSIDAVPSILSSIPSLMNNSFISSSFSLNKINGLPKILKKEGYNTSFFHGAFNGSQNFDQYTKIAGFDHYFGKDQYTGKEAFDGTWGIFDEEFLQFYATKLSSFQQPFFSSLFTISSHNPYTIPEKYKGKFPKGTTTIQESIAYTDFALREFFKTAKNQSWYNNTLFVISADHTSSGGDIDIDKTNIGKFRIPILFFDPSNPEFMGINEKNFQQIDIMPSILDYLNIKTEMVSFGKSYKSPKNFVVYYLQGTYHYIQDDYYLVFADNQTNGLYNWKKDVLLKNNLMQQEKPRVKEYEKFLKAYIQSFNERITNNQLAF
ncbi:sulfatase [Flavobacterium aquidurense]|jgi:phosphoglycerol transferase MdoB-like AlkP superfamily enzyme|uniref:LTA synthase family protein n=1 Tax=Flavobacterium aquidurense TaxID=362413 RepID=UPI000921A704|nr:alkaline phosphatase family protein [Flavobacterium aquidurense]OXA73495.1 sulfatase [Flavobacterium aquidurense]SHG23657.1 Phosphoglycerol transferase MdoB [Flavobacterium frigidimaris]